MDRKDLRFLLFQARNPGDPIREEERASFAHMLRVDLHQVISIDILSDSPSQHHLTGIHAILVGGAGEHSVIEPVPAVARAMAFLARQAQKGFPIFGSCFGFHMLVQGLGGEIIHDEDHAQIGTFNLELTPEGQRDPVFSCLPAAFPAQEGHKDRAARFPEGAINLATSPGCPFQALTLPGKPVYATQFHPELDDVTSSRRLLCYIENYGPSDADVLHEMLDTGFWPSPHSSDLLVHFVDQVLLPYLGGSQA